MYIPITLLPSKYFVNLAFEEVSLKDHLKYTDFTQTAKLNVAKRDLETTINMPVNIKPGEKIEVSGELTNKKLVKVLRVLN
jgi:spore germination protein YaaH